MLFLRMILALAAILISFCAPKPMIWIQNLSNKHICYKVEYSNGTGAFPNDTVCGGAKGDHVAGFWLNSSQLTSFPAVGSDGEHFNGAITAVLKDNTVWGARNEVNLLFPGKAWYDVDYQYGISDGTCGPPNSRNLSGEKDALGTANTAWKSLNHTTKKALLAYPKYLNGSVNGSLTSINMGLEAWPNATAVLWFFQKTAGFKAYMSPGSVENVIWSNNTVQAELVRMADSQVMQASTDQIVITSY